MKKIVIVIMLFTILLFGGCSCNETGEKILITTPDGAPSFSISQMMNENYKGEKIEYKVINSENIQNYVVNQISDIAIVPLNVATKLSRDVYQISGVVTHGNLFILGKETLTDLNTLNGKKIAVIQYANVPGLTFRAMLKAKNIEYKVIANLNDEIDTDKVNIYGCEPTAVVNLLKSGNVDYVLTAEPSATVALSKTTELGTKICLDIQAEYKKIFNTSFPQAVVMVKKSLIESNKKLVDSIIKKMKENQNFLTADNVDAICETIKNHCEDGYTTTISKANLNAEVLKNCNVKYETVEDMKESIYKYIEEIRKVDNTKINEIDDSKLYLD